jgi:FkbM family methyltransferase
MFLVKRSHIGAATLVLAGSAVAVYTWSPARLFALVVTGHSPVCPMAQALKSSASVRDEIRIKDRILAASRLIREESGLELWETPKGRYWIPKGNRFVLPFNLAEMERHIYGEGEHFIHPGDIVLDCGASDGDFTREALKAGAAKVVSVEISPSSAECIRRNFADEIETGRVVVYPKGVWDQEDRLTLMVDNANYAANTVALTSESLHPSIEVPLTTIDRLVAELGLPRVDFIKMDIEGAEVRAIAGAGETIRRYRPRLAIATEHKPDDETAIPAAVRKIQGNYRMKCGPCVENNGHIRPDVLYFY